MPHILIIDDDLIVLNLFEQFLSSDGFSVSVAKDGREGLDLMKKQKPDLIITDIMMPEVDGLEMIREIRSQHPEISVIAISGGMKGAQINFLPHAKKFGACRVFEKPVSLFHLRTAVRELLGISPASS